MKNTKQIALATLILALGMVIVGTTRASAAILRVDDDGAQCPTATFTTIQAAVNAAVAGDTIQVCQGIYSEQVKITKSLTLTGLSSNNTSRPEIRPPAGGAVTNSARPSGSLISALILVSSAANVNVFNLTVNGLNSGSGSSDLVGIYYINASGTILNNAVKNISSPNPGISQAAGIYVANTDSVTRQVDILNNVVLHYEKNGILAQKDGTVVTVGGNYVFGIGLESAPAPFNPAVNPGIIQNGIEIGRGATGNINNNRVSDNLYRGCQTAPGNCNNGGGINILIFDTAPAASPLLVELNNVSKGNDGIVSVGATFALRNANGATYRLNLIHASEVGGGLTIDGNNNTILENKILGVDGTAIQILQGTGNTITNNVINDAAIGVARILTGNNQSNNTFINVNQNIDPAPPSSFTKTFEQNRNSRFQEFRTFTSSIKYSPASD